MDNFVRVLKGVVIGGGVLLMAGTILLIVLIVMRSGERSPAEDAERQDAGIVEKQPAQGCHSGQPPSEPVDVVLPAGGVVEQIVPDGGCLVLLGTDQAGQQFIAVVDPRSGERISLILLQPQP
ncbi:MAG: hypothetical protein AAF637_26575 [Pseudomonadota bacterium]